MNLHTKFTDSSFGSSRDWASFSNNQSQNKMKLNLRNILSYLETYLGKTNYLAILDAKICLVFWKPLVNVA